ncbi:hypothetical protein C8R43DRAFT_1126550 [Mycena crocata]|nr:hypothetical protein C8R43DRAFT_1126550 [Mycena crocata]
MSTESVTIQNICEASKAVPPAESATTDKSSEASEDVESNHGHVETEVFDDNEQSVFSVDDEDSASESDTDIPNELSNNEQLEQSSEPVTETEVVPSTESNDTANIEPSSETIPQPRDENTDPTSRFRVTPNQYAMSVFVGLSALDKKWQNKPASSEPNSEIGTIEDFIAGVMRETNHLQDLQALKMLLNGAPPAHLFEFIRFMTGHLWLHTPGPKEDGYLEVLRAVLPNENEPDTSTPGNGKQSHPESDTENLTPAAEATEFNPTYPEMLYVAEPESTLNADEAATDSVIRVTLSLAYFADEYMTCVSLCMSQILVKSRSVLSFVEPRVKRNFIEMVVQETNGLQNLQTFRTLIKNAHVFELIVFAKWLSRIGALWIEMEGESDSEDELRELKEEVTVSSPLDPSSGVPLVCNPRTDTTMATESANTDNINFNHIADATPQPGVESNDEESEQSSQMDISLPRPSLMLTFPQQ